MRINYSNVLSFSREDSLTPLVKSQEPLRRIPVGTRSFVNLCNQRFTDSQARKELDYKICNDYKFLKMDL